MSHVGFDLLSSSSSKIIDKFHNLKMGSSATPDITLYTNYGCPWAHRAQIILKELELPFKTEIIDLNVPRTPEYLKINPRGLVPAIKYDGEIITESAIVAQFLADAHPSHILKSSTEEGGALQRARINFFVDAYFSKVNPNFFGIIKATGEEQEAEATKFVDAIIKEIEPLLADAKPFFGGSSKLTFAEVLTGSFLLRVLSFPKYGLLPKSLPEALETKTPNFWKWANAVVKEESVTYIWDEAGVAERTKARIEKLKAAAK